MQNAAVDDEDDDEEEDEAPAKPSLARGGKKGGKAAAAVRPNLFKQLHEKCLRLLLLTCCLLVYRALRFSVR